MLAMVKACYEIRVLRGRRTLGASRFPVDGDAVTGLERRLRAAARMSSPVACSFKCDGGQTIDGQIVQLTPDGALVTTRSRPQPGARTSLKIRDEGSCREYHFPCEIVTATETDMIVRLLSVPVECRYQPSAPVADDVRQPRAA